MIASFFLMILAAIFPACALADRSDGLTGVFDSLINVGMTVHALIQAICIVAGVGLILGAIIQYKKYRQNPIETRLTTVILNAIIGMALIILAFIPPQFIAGK